MFLFCLKYEKLLNLLHCGDLSLCVLLFSWPTLLQSCLTHQHRNTLQLIHVSFKVSHCIQDLKAMNHKIWFYFLEYLLITYNHFFALCRKKMDF